MLSFKRAAAAMAAMSLMLLLGCSQNGTSTTVTIQDVQNEIKATCSYVPTIESIAAVAATIASGINPAAGATATVLISTSNAIVTEICKAVQAQQTKLGAKATAEQDVAVTVNGVTVHGKLVPGDKS